MDKFEIHFLNVEYEGRALEKHGVYFRQETFSLENDTTAPEKICALKRLYELEVWKRLVYEDDEGNKYYSSFTKVRTVKVHKMVFEGRYKKNGVEEKFIIDGDYLRMSSAEWRCWLLCKGLSEYDVKVYHQLVFKDDSGHEYFSDFACITF